MYGEFIAHWALHVNNPAVCSFPINFQIRGICNRFILHKTSNNIEYTWEFVKYRIAISVGVICGCCSLK